MLSEEERKEIDEEISRSGKPHGAAIDALRIVQRRRGWISDEAIDEIAAYLEMTPHQLDSIATFYNLLFRKPVGEHIILLCDSVSCWICGYDGIRKHLEQRLGIKYGETTLDGQFTLLPVPCLGTCDKAPAMMIDDELFNDLDFGRVDAALNRYATIRRGNGNPTHEKHPAR